jgi:hypothetical protein
MVFGHRKCFGGHRVLIGSPEGVPGTPGKRYGPYGPRGETHQPQGAGAPPIWAGQGGEVKGKEERKESEYDSPFLLSSPLSFPSGAAHMGGAAAPAGCCVSPLGPLGPYLLPGVPGTPSSDRIRTRYPLEHFRCLNTIVLYIHLYLSTILRLLIMSVISSGTPNNIRSPNHITHIIQNRHRTLSMRTLRVRELCRHDRDTSPVNNQ